MEFAFGFADWWAKNNSPRKNRHTRQGKSNADRRSEQLSSTPVTDSVHQRLKKSTACSTQYLRCLIRREEHWHRYPDAESRPEPWSER
jgi:hypothetical protein